MWGITVVLPEISMFSQKPTKTVMNFDQRVAKHPKAIDLAIDECYFGLSIPENLYSNSVV